MTAVLAAGLWRVGSLLQPAGVVDSTPQVAEIVPAAESDPEAHYTLAIARLEEVTNADQDVLDQDTVGAINAGLTGGLDLPDWADDIDVASTIDLYDEYWTDRQQSRENRAGVYELGERNAISSGFNTKTRAPAAGGKATEWDLYMRDLPSRRILEQNLSGMSRKLDKIQGEYRAKPSPMALGM